MEYVKNKDKIIGKCGIEGLLKAEFEHEIKEVKSKVSYEGPKIPPGVWRSVLAFFKWTNTEYHSESQVRLYVNPTAKAWRAWAFPQEADTGMTTKEIAQQETPEEAMARFTSWGFPDQSKWSEWIYFGTAHHHCGCSAFQSGTDLDNEKNQDGIHITMGNIGSPKYDIHARFMVGGRMFDVDLSYFWDIGKQASDLLPKDLWGNVAKHQMCIPHNVDFPEEWKKNCIKLERKTTSHLPNTGAAMGLGGGGPYKGYWSKTWHQRIEECIAWFIWSAMENAPGKLTWKDIDDYWDVFRQEPYSTLIEALKENHMEIGDLLKWWPDNEQAAASLCAGVELAMEQASNGNGGKKKKKKDREAAQQSQQTQQGPSSQGATPEELEAWRTHCGYE